MNLQETARPIIAWWKRQDPFGLFVATALMVPDIGHAGKLFADREAAGYGRIGHILAGCIDAVFVIAFRKAAKTKHLSRRIYAVFVAVMACVVNGAFNVAYYRDSYPADPFAVSLTLGASAPVLAALLSILQAVDKKERLEQEQADVVADRALELEKFHIEQAAITERQVAVEAERTKQIRAQARAERAKAEAQAQKAAEAERQAAEAETNRRATIADWRAIYAGMNGNRADLDADTVAAAVEAAGFSLPSRRSLQNWAREAAEAQSAPAPRPQRAAGAREEGE